MAIFKLSAFADEATPIFDEQLCFLRRHDISYLEIRGVDGKPFSELTQREMAEVGKKLDASGIRISAVGSPLGKISILEKLEPHLELAKHVFEGAGAIGAERIRMFSFYMPEGEDPGQYRAQTTEALGRLLDTADAFGVTLYHENEKGIYGDTAARCLDILESFGGRLRAVFDHANFLSCGEEPFPHAYQLLSPYIDYLHIKDADESGEMVPAGQGKGRIPETLETLNRAVSGEFILTLEPHLIEFGGLSGLENAGHESKIGNKYASGEQAFEAAIQAINTILEGIQ